MVNYNVPQDLIDHIKSLEDRIISLERRPRAGNTSVDNNYFRVTDTDGNTVFEAGEFPYPYDNSLTMRGVAFIRQGTTPGPASLTMGEIEGFTVHNITTIYDYSGNAIFADDVVSEQGLARPYLAIPFKNADFSTWPSTTSGTFVGIEDAYYLKQHPKLNLRYALYCNAADTSAEIQLLADGVQVGSTGIFPVGLGPGTIATDNIIGTVAGSHEQAVTLAVQIRRTAGTGTVFGKVITCYGIQT